MLPTYFSERRHKFGIFSCKKVFRKSKLMTFNGLNPISTGTGWNQPSIVYHVTGIGLSEQSKMPLSFWTKFGICSHSDHLLEGEDG